MAKNNQEKHPIIFCGKRGNNVDGPQKHVAQELKISPLIASCWECGTTLPFLRHRERFCQNAERDQRSGVSFHHFRTF